MIVMPYCLRFSPAHLANSLLPSPSLSIGASAGAGHAEVILGDGRESRWRQCQDLLAAVLVAAAAGEEQEKRRRGMSLDEDEEEGGGGGSGGGVNARTS
jgi:hypothetical protein